MTQEMARGIVQSILKLHRLQASEEAILVLLTPRLPGKERESKEAGAKFILSCSDCEEVVDAEDRFCKKCGQPLEQYEVCCREFFN